MLTLSQFKIRYPNWTYLIDPFNEKEYGEILSEGFLEFTNESALNWGGPFPGNHARYVLCDYSSAMFLNGKHKGKRKLDVWDARREEAIRKYKSGFHPECKWVIHPIDCASNKSPIRLWLLGNDDSSYSKFYSAKQIAIDELNLFIANEPCDYNEIIKNFNFIFTN